MQTENTLEGRRHQSIREENSKVIARKGTLAYEELHCIAAVRC